nr:hypothetical protein [Tanacetum cinerariifolium]
MYDDYIGGQPSATARTVPPVQEPEVRQSSTASTTIADIAPIPTNSSSFATNILISLQDVDELNPNAMVDGNLFVNPFANPSTSAATASSSQQNVDPSNMHTFYQPYPHEFQWTKDHPLEQNDHEGIGKLDAKDLLFEAMYDDYIGGQPSATARTVPPVQEPEVRQSSTASTTIADIAPIPTNSSSFATNILISLQDVDELNPNAM